MGSARRLRLYWAVALIPCLGAAAAAHARVAPLGALRQLRPPQACFSWPPLDGCRAVRGVDIGLGAVAVTPDGRNVYVGSGAAGSVLEFRRDHTGALHQLAAPYFCLGGANSGRLCPRQAAGLQDTSGIAVSPDGRNVYLGSGGASAVVALSRGRGGGLRQLRGADACIGEPGALDQGGSSCPAKAPGLYDPAGIAIAPGGRDVYALSWYDSTLIVLARRRGGGLRFRQCVQERGLAGRYYGTAGCSASATGLTDASQVRVSPDGHDVYVSSPDSRSVATFARQRNGRVRQLGCVGQAGWECGAVNRDLEMASGLAISPDGRSVYLGARSLILTLRRSRDGRLHPSGGRASCVGVPGSGCPRQGPGLSRVVSLAVSRDGRSVYATGYMSNALVALSRLRDGSLRELSPPFDCLSPYPPSGCHAPARNLWSPPAVTVSPDGRNVYATGEETNALDVFTRRR